MAEQLPLKQFVEGSSPPGVTKIQGLMLNYFVHQTLNYLSDFTHRPAGLYEEQVYFTRTCGTVRDLNQLGRNDRDVEPVTGQARRGSSSAKKILEQVVEEFANLFQCRPRFCYLGCGRRS